MIYESEYFEQELGYSLLRTWIEPAKHFEQIGHGIEVLSAPESNLIGQCYMIYKTILKNNSQQSNLFLFDSLIFKKLESTRYAGTV